MGVVHSAILDSVSDAVLAVDGDGVVRACNRPLRMLFGLPPDSGGMPDLSSIMAALSLAAPVPETLWRVDREAISTAVATGPTRIALVGGREVWRTTSPWPSVDGREAGWIWTFRDATREHELAANLRRAEDRFRMIAAAAGEYIWETDADGRFAFVSDRAQEVLGYPRSEMLGRSPFDFMPPDVRAAMEPEVLDRRARLAPFSGVEHIFLHRDGHPVWQRVSGMPISGGDGQLLGYRGLALDVTDTRRASQQADEADRRFRDMAANVPGVIYQWYQRSDGSRGYYYISPRITDLYGVSVDEVMSNVQALALHPDDVETFEDSIRRAVDNGADWWFEGRFVMPDGSSRWWRGVSRPVKISPDEVVFNGIIIDIDDTKRLEEALRTTQERFQLAILGTDTGIWDWDLSTGEVFLSPTWLAILGYPPNGLPQRVEAWSSRVHPQDLAESWLQVTRHLEGRTELYQNDQRLRHRDGTWRWVSVRGKAVLDGQGRPYRVVGLMTDIQEQKATEQNLRASERRYRDLIETSVVGIVIFRQGVPLYVNRSHVRLLGLEGTEPLVGVSLARLLPQVVMSEADAIERQLAAGRTAWECERLPLIRADGTEIVVNLLARRLDWMGEPAVEVSMLDVTDQVRYEREVDMRRRQLEETATHLASLAENLDAARQDADRHRRRAEEANRSKSRFLAMMSHEIRTPMTSVIGMIDLLLETGLTDQQQTYMSTMRSSAGAQMTLLNDLLDYSRFEAGGLRLEKIDFDASEVLGDVAELHRPLASENGTALSIDIRTKPPIVRGDPMRVRQILTNLTGNAVKFTQRGHIELRLEAVVEKDQQVLLTFAVADDGIGIPPGRLARLFTAFEQVDTSTTRRYGGTGLGLSICRHLVTMMDGDIWAESAEGEGSTFRFTLNLERGQRPAAKPGITDAWDSMAVPEAPSRPLRILVAEDTKANRLLIVTMLERRGHRVDSVENGREAVDAVRSGPYDLILMDMQMPEMDGAEALAQIRRLPTTVDYLPIIALTADAVPESRTRGLAAGFDDYVTKPIDWAQLDRAIARVLGMAEASG